MSRIEDSLADSPTGRQWLVAGVGVALTVAAAGYFLRYGQQTRPVVMVTTILPAVALAVYGGWFWMGGARGARGETVVAWAVGGATLMFALERWEAIVDTFGDESTWRAVVQHTSIGALGGAVAGTYAERARWRADTRLRLLSALDATMDGIIVLDRDGVIRYANSAFTSAYGSDDVVGDHWRACYTEDATDRIEEVLDAVSGDDRASWQGTVVARREDDATYPQDLSMTTLDDGYVWVCRDVTDREERDQRLRVLNRVLRHNVRNALNVVLGRADRLTERRGADEDVESIVEAADDLLEASEQARQLERSLSASSTAEETLADVVADAVAAVRDDHPDVEFDVNANCGAAVDERLRVAVRELVETVVEHCDADPVQVTVTATTNPPSVRVADNGSGLPEHEQRALDGAEETALQHASGLGLWLVYWLVTATGGDVEVADDDAVVLYPAAGKN